MEISVFSSSELEFAENTSKNLKKDRSIDRSEYRKQNDKHTDCLYGFYKQSQLRMRFPCGAFIIEWL